MDSIPEIRERHEADELVACPDFLQKNCHADRATLLAHLERIAKMTQDAGDAAFAKADDNCADFVMNEFYALADQINEPPGPSK